MAAQNQKADASLSSKFNAKSIWHGSMMLMMFTMATATLANVASLMATGVPIGALDALGMYINMHIPSAESLTLAADGVVGVWDSAMQGNWVTDNFWTDPHAVMGHSAHAAHAGHAMHTAHAAAAASPQLSPEALELLGMN
jgi:hypothetical protein